MSTIAETSKQQEISKQKEEQIQDNPKFILKATFLLVGFCQFIGWNAVLATFYFFAVQFDFTVFHKFTIITQVGQIIAAAAIYPLAKKFTIITRIGVTLGLVAIILLLLPTIAITMPNQTGLNIALVLILFSGFLNATAENSMNAIAGQEGGKLNQILWSGGGLCGLCMAILAILLNLSFSSLENSVTISAFIFFILSAFSIFTAVYLLKRYANSKGIKTYIVPKDPKETIPYLQQKQSSMQELDSESNSQTTQTDLSREPSQQMQIALDSQKQFQEKQSLWQQFLISFKYARFLPICIFLIFFSTFAVFPKLTLIQVQFTSEFLNKHKQLWATLLLNLVFNFSDCLGKYVGGLNFMKNIKFQYFLTIFRLSFIATSLCIAYRQGDLFASEWFPFVNMFCLSFTAGTGTSSIMELAPRSAKGDKQIAETISFICSNLLVLGIFLGSIVAVPLDPNYEIKYYFDE